MANVQGALQKGAPYGFLGLVIIVHAFDIFLRYGTSPFNISVGQIQSGGSPVLWLIFFLPYSLLFLFATRLDAFRDMSKKGLLIISFLAYIWGPFWSVLPGFFPAIKYFAALLLLFAPVWLIVLLYATQEFPKLSLGFSIVWLFIITFSLFPQIKDFAAQQGRPLPDSLTPALVIQYAWEKIKETWTNFYQFTFVQAPALLKEEIERSIAQAQGDYYTGKVEEGAQKRLGVYIENFKPTDLFFYENKPVIATATIKAETLDKELDITVSCSADDENTIAEVRPKAQYTVLQTDQFDVDCIWKKLDKGIHNLKLQTQFGFTTRAYLKSYIMDRDRLREYRRQNIDPLVDVLDRNPVAIYTTGPVRIGMGIGQQPIPLGRTTESLPPLGITIENNWEGKVIQVKDVFLFVPEGIGIDSAYSTEFNTQPIACEKLPEEDQNGCDNSLVDVYQINSQELQSLTYRNLTTKNIRVYLKSNEPNKVLGNAPIAVRNFKVTVNYDYLLERTATASVREAET